jgi:F-type H+-transporting ATPase subunit delta
MAASKAATRYARALLDLAIEMKNLDAVYNDVVMIDGLCYSNRDLVAFLHSPIIQRRKKYQVFDALFEGKIDNLSLNFLKLITKNGREKILPEITESFIAQYKKHNGILDVHVTSAIALEPKVKELIIAKVKESFEGDIHLYEEVDQSLVGGFIVNVEDKQIDASIRRQLADLRNILLN